MFQVSATSNCRPNSNRNLSVSALLTGIAQTNQEIKASATVSAEADK